jgi:superfamily II DNA or RNA helicase
LLVIETPTKLRIIGHDDKFERLEKLLTYTDKSVDFAIRQLRNAHWFSPDSHGDKLAELMEQKRKCLLMQDKDGLYTLAGFAEYLKESLLENEVVNKVVYPEAKVLPWKTVPPDLRDYQNTAKNILLDAKYGPVEMGTGLGKSFIIMHIAKTLGLKFVVMCPSTSIADQLYEDFTRYLGQGRIGRYYGGKKDCSKLGTIAISASLARIDRDSSDWAEFSKTQVFVADESHLTPASTLKDICLGLFADVPYRFFFSGTQTRGDGAELLLRGIIGEIRYRMSVADGVAQGWLARPSFKMVQVVSNDTYESRDVNKMTRRHLLYNPIVNKKAADIANAAVSRLGHQVLILVDEIEQFKHLQPHFQHACAFAYGTLTSENERYVQEQYRCNDNGKLIEDFNDGKIPILVGTSAVSIGTNIKSPKTGIYIRGGKSPIDVPQSVGRMTRLADGKDSFTWIDFDVTNIDTLHRHAAERVRLYKDIYDDVEII